MLLLTGAIMVTALAEVCRAEADQRYFPQEADWISEKVSTFLFASLTFSDHLLLSAGAEQESYFTETAEHSEH